MGCGTNSPIEFVQNFSSALREFFYLSNPNSGGDNLIPEIRMRNIQQGVVEWQVIFLRVLRVIKVVVEEEEEKQHVEKYQADVKMNLTEKRKQVTTGNR